MKSKRRFIAAAAAAALLLTSCTGSDLIPASSEVSVTFSWWCSDIGDNYTVTAVEQFSEMNPDIDVLTEFSELDFYRKHIFVSYAAGSEPDVMQLGYDWMYHFETAGDGLYDITELQEHIDLSTFSSDQLSYGTVGGKLVGIPIALDAETFFYNRDIYDKYELPLPEKWSDLFRAASVMGKDGVYPIEMDKSAAWLSCIAYQEQRTGTRCYDQSGRLRFGRSDFSDMLTFYKSLIDEGVMKHYSERAKNDFAEGVSAGVLCWCSDTDYYCQPLINKGVNVQIGSYINSVGSIISGWYVKPTGLYSIKKTTKHPTEAAKLVDFLVNSQEMAHLQGTDKGIPLSRAMLEVLEADEALGGLRYLANNRLSRSNELGMISPCQEDEALVEAFDRAVSLMLYEGMEPEELAGELYTAASNAAI